MSELSQVCVMESYTQARYMSELSQQMEEQKARKAAEEQAQVETEKWKHFENTLKTHSKHITMMNLPYLLILETLGRDMYTLYSKREIPGSGLVGGKGSICGWVSRSPSESGEKRWWEWWDNGEIMVRRDGEIMVRWWWEPGERRCWKDATRWTYRCC